MRSESTLDGVIMPKVAGDDDTTLPDDFLSIDPIPGAFDTLRRLVDERFAHRVFIVSKAGPRVEAKTLRWFKKQKFCDATGLEPKHVHFCRERRDKDGVCRRETWSGFFAPELTKRAVASGRCSRDRMFIMSVGTRRPGGRDRKSS